MGSFLTAWNWKLYARASISCGKKQPHGLLQQILTVRGIVFYRMNFKDNVNKLSFHAVKNNPTDRQIFHNLIHILICQNSHILIHILICDDKNIQKNNCFWKLFDLELRIPPMFFLPKSQKCLNSLFSKHARYSGADFDRHRDHLPIQIGSNVYKKGFQSVVYLIRTKNTFLISQI